MTYPDEDVQALLGERTIPFKPKIDDNGELAKRFGAQWTPGLVWLTPNGDVAHSNVGYFEPEEFQAELVFGTAKAAVSEGDWQRARELFSEVTDRWPDSQAAPAAMYWSGVAGYKATKDVSALKTPWLRLLDEHPDSAWAMKASFLRG